MSVKKVNGVTDLKDIRPGNIILWMHKRHQPRYMFSDVFFDIVESTSRIQDSLCGYTRMSFFLDLNTEIHYSSYEGMSFTEPILEAYDILILDSIDEMIDALPVTIGIQRSDIIVEGAIRYAIILSRSHQDSNHETDNLPARDNLTVGHGPTFAPVDII